MAYRRDTEMQCSKTKMGVFVLIENSLRPREGVRRRNMNFCVTWTLMSLPLYACQGLWWIIFLSLGSNWISLIWSNFCWSLWCRWIKVTSCSPFLNLCVVSWSSTWLPSFALFLRNPHYSVSIEHPLACNVADTATKFPCSVVNPYGIRKN